MDTGGGGVCLYAKKELDVLEYYDPILLNEAVEQIWCRIKLPSETVLVGCIYIKPKSNENVYKSVAESLIKAIDLKTARKVSTLLVCGDFNMPELEYENQLPNQRESISSDSILIESIIDLGLYQHVDWPTFSRSNNILDLVITYTENRVLEVQKEPILGKVDNGHFGLLWEFILKTLVDVSL